MQMESLKQYITVDSRNMHLRIANKMEDATWKFSELTEKVDLLFIDSIGFNIPLKDIYSGIKF